MPYSRADALCHFMGYWLCLAESLHCFNRHTSLPLRRHLVAYSPAHLPLFDSSGRAVDDPALESKSPHMLRFGPQESQLVRMSALSFEVSCLKETHSDF